MSSGQAGDGGGQAYQRVADELLSRLSGGRYPHNSSLPTQRQLAEEFGVSRDTVQKVLRMLAGEGWIEARQGSGTRVVRGPSSARRTGVQAAAQLGDRLDAAFRRPKVTLDVFTLTSQSLTAHLQVQAGLIRARHAEGKDIPREISVRILVPSENLLLAYPRALENSGDARPQERLRAITRRHLSTLRSVLRELRADGLVPSVEVRVGRVPLTPAFKLYVLNRDDVLFGPYRLVERRMVFEDDTELPVLDVLGLGSPLTHFVRDGERPSKDSAFVESMQAWFDSVWNKLGVGDVTTDV
ncbi:GntR family transcriptional regulator [Streptomyces sp. NPDC050803]|uniref:GntR family transcriptional regulator n=1 Tax=unclassified Streptomyces TaxID=2593676 RepID=UPI0034387790